MKAIEFLSATKAGLTLTGYKNGEYEFRGTVSQWKMREFNYEFYDKFKLTPVV